MDDFEALDEKIREIEEQYKQTLQSEAFQKSFSSSINQALMTMQEAKQSESTRACEEV